MVQARINAGYQMHHEGLQYRAGDGIALGDDLFKVLCEKGVVSPVEEPKPAKKAEAKPLQKLDAKVDYKVDNKGDE